MWAPSPSVLPPQSEGERIYSLENCSQHRMSVAVGRVEFKDGVVGATVMKGGDEDREGVLGGYGVGVSRD